MPSLGELYRNRNNDEASLRLFYHEALKTGTSYGSKIVLLSDYRRATQIIRNDLHWIVNGVIQLSLDGCAQAAKYVACYLNKLKYKIIDHIRSLERHLRREIPSEQTENILGRNISSRADRERVEYVQNAPIGL